MECWWVWSEVGKEALRVLEETEIEQVRVSRFYLYDCSL